MPEKAKILVYTDCHSFAGCEKPVFRTVTSPAFSERYDCVYVYRSTAAYQAGMRAFSKSLPARMVEVRYPDIDTWTIFLQKIISVKLMQLVSLMLRTFFLLLKPLLFPYQIIRSYLIIKAEKPDIIHINNGGYPGAFSCLAAAIAARLAGQDKVIMTVTNLATPRKGLFQFLVDYFALPEILYFTSGSANLGRTIHEQRGVPSQRLRTIHHGALTQIVHDQDPSDKDFIIMVTRFEERKGHVYLFEAFKRLLANGNNVGLKLYLIGDGPLLEQMKAKAAALGIADNIVFWGHRDDYLGLVKKSLFLVNPSTGWEDFPLIILEAMSVGIPVIGSNVCGIPEQIENGISGLLVEPRDAAGLYAVMRSLLDDPGKRAKIGQAAKKRFDDNFTVDIMINNYLRLYEELLKQKDQA